MTPMGAIAPMGALARMITVIGETNDDYWAINRHYNVVLDEKLDRI